MKLPEKLRVFKARNNIRYVDIADYIGVSEQAVKNWSNKDRCPKIKLKLAHAEMLVKFTHGIITLKDCGY